MPYSLGNRCWCCHQYSRFFFSFSGHLHKETQTRIIFSCFRSIVDGNVNERWLYKKKFTQSKIFGILFRYFWQFFGFCCMIVVYAMFYKDQTEIDILIYNSAWFSWLITAYKLDRDKTFDAFISHSHHDIDSIETHLVVERWTKSIAIMFALLRLDRRRNYNQTNSEIRSIIASHDRGISWNWIGADLNLV